MRIAAGVAGGELVYVDLWGRRFTRLPELDLERVDGRRVRGLLERQVTAPPLKTGLETRLDELGLRAA